MSVSIILSTGAICAFGEDDSTTDTTVQEESTTTAITAEEAQAMLEQQRTDLEAKLKASQEKLDELEGTQKDTEAYIDALDEKIGYLNEELNLLDQEVADATAKVNTLKKDIKKLKKQEKELQAQCDEIQQQIDKLDDEFNATYQLYCQRLRALYIRGNTSVISALLLCDDISQFIDRYEMVQAVSDSDTQLLKNVEAKMNEILTQKNGLEKTQNDLNAKKELLTAKEQEYETQQNEIESKQNEIAQKKVTLAEDRAESDRLLAEYTGKTEMYTEYRNEDQELIDAVDSEIDALLSGLKSPEEATTAVEATGDKQTTNSSQSDDSSLYSKSNAVLNMTYPAPNHYSVSCNFGYYSNGKPHTGMDFPYPTGSKVVAAQKGIVITVKRLNYSYGYYVMIYHGTDAKGRKIVTLYAHNSSILVSVGQTVEKGQQIAKGGSTGNSTGPHCHFEVIIDGTKVNPKNYLSK
jgi:murein DD-endopeptidase MepM/ murein hydrolase activator NlpD